MKKIYKKKYKKKIQICVAGWHFFDNFYKQLKLSKLRVHVVAHRYNKILDKVNNTVIDNVGLEYGMYNYFINNIWDIKSNIFFIHDDTIIKDDLDNFILRNYLYFKKNKVDLGYIVSSRIIGPGQRCFYMSKKLLKIVKNKYGGMWYDKDNLGYTSKKTQPEQWHPRRYNDGVEKFKEMIGKINKKYYYYHIKKVTSIDHSFIMYHRGKDEIKSIYTSKEKKLRRKKINRQKRKRIKEEKKYDKNCEK